MYEPPFVSAITFVNAAVSVVFPWSTWPIVPTFTCGLLRSNFSLDIALLLPLHHRRHDRLRCGGVVVKLHGVERAALSRGAQRADVPEHPAERHLGVNHLAVA